MLKDPESWVCFESQQLLGIDQLYAYSVLEIKQNQLDPNLDM